VIEKSCLVENVQD